MATDLTGLKVKDTYNSLLKIGDNSSLSATPDKISDGLGNESILYLSTSQVSIGTLPATGYDLTVNSAIKTGSIDIVGAATAATLRLTGGSGSQGTLSWNTDEETVDIIQNGATLQVGQEVQVHVKNQTGSTITDGTPVYVTGTLGSSGRLTVAPMIADGTIEAKYFLGITTEDIPNGEDGKVTTFGKIRGLDTTAYSEGQTLYVSASTAGAFQTTAPVAPNLDLEVAIVINVSANNGTIFVRAQNGHYLGLLHDVYLNSPANNQFLVYNSTTSRWENQGIASVGSINLDSVTDNGNTTTNNISVGDITAGNMTLSGYLRGAGTFVIDPSPYADDAGVVQILGDLRVDGTTTTINSTTVTIDDKNIVLASGSATAADANGAGITIDGASANITYRSSTDDFAINKKITIQKNGVGLELENTATSGADTAMRIRGARNGQNYSFDNLTSYILFSNYDDNTTPNSYDLAKIGAGMYDADDDTGFFQIQVNDGTALVKALDIEKNKDATFYGSVTATSLIKDGGSSSQFLKADGSVDSNTYLQTESDTLQSVTNRGSATTNDITISGTLALNNADSLSFEGGNHWITYNDGEGNFNIRVGHYSNATPDEECTEAGYIFHDEWSQTAGWRQFNVSADSMTVGQLIGTDSNWRTQIEYDPSSVWLRYQGNTRLQTASDGIDVTGNINLHSSKLYWNTDWDYLMFDDDSTDFTIHANTTLLTSRSDIVFQGNANDGTSSGNFIFWNGSATSGSEVFVVKEGGNVNIVSGALQIGGTTTIDSSRNVFANDVTGNDINGTFGNFGDVFLTNVTGASLAFRNSQGNTVDTDNLATVSFQGYYNSAFVGASRIQVKANEDFSATARGTVINFDFWDTGSVYDTAAYIASDGVYVGTTNLYNNLPDGITWSKTDNRFKIGVSKIVGGTTETAIDDLVLATSMDVDYVPYVSSAGGDGDTVNAILSQSWLKFNSDTLEVGNVSDPFSVDSKIIKISRQIAPNEKQISEFKAQGIFVTSTTATYGTKNSSLQFYTNGRLNINGAFTLPEGDGTSGQVLGTDGSGVVSWVSGVATISDLQAVTDNGDSTTNTITAGGFSTSGQVAGQYLTLSNQELTLNPPAYSIWLDANDSNAPATLGGYSGSAPLGIYVNGDDGISTTTLGSGTVQVYHTGHFSGTNISNWQSAYTFSNTFDITDYTDPKYLRSDATDSASGNITFNGAVGFDVSPDTSYDVTVQDNMRFYDSANGLAYSPVEGGASAARYFLRFDYTNNASYPFLTNRTPNGAVVIKTGTAAGGGENEHFRIEGGDGTVDAYFTNTRLGIGTTTPSYTIDVSGDARVTTGLFLDRTTGLANIKGTGEGHIVIDPLDASHNVYLSHYVAGDVILAGGGGNVGIGTTSPTAPLHIEGGASSEVLKIEANADPYIRWVENGTNVGFLQFKGGEAYLSNQSNGTFFFRTNNTNKMVITGGGEVGIGTISPTTGKLVVAGDDNAYAIRIDGGTTTGQSYGLRVRAGTNGSDNALVVEDTSANSLLTVRGDGLFSLNVGRGVVYFENNGNSNSDGRGITLRTTANPVNGSIFDVRSSGQGSRLFVGQSITTAGINPFYVGSPTTGSEYDASQYAIALNTDGTIDCTSISANNLIASAAFSVAANRFKLVLTTEDSNTIEASLDDVVLSNAIDTNYVPYVTTAGGNGDTTNAYLSNSFLKINSSTLELDWGNSPGVYTERNLKMRKDGGGFGTYYEATYAADSVSFLHYASASDIDTAKVGATSTGRIRINDAYSLPIGDGTNGQVLKTNGSGDLSWGSASGFDRLEETADALLLNTTTTTGIDVSENHDGHFLINGMGYILDTNTTGTTGRLGYTISPSPHQPSIKTSSDAGASGIGGGDGSFPNTVADSAGFASATTYTFADAIAGLQGDGARLPRLEEVCARYGSGTGDGTDSEWIWTQTFGAKGYVYQVKGRFDSYPDFRLVDPTNTANVARVRRFFDISKANLPVYYDNNARINVKEIRAEHSDGLKLHDDGGNGLHIQDGGYAEFDDAVGINTAPDTGSGGSYLKVQGGSNGFKAFRIQGGAYSSIGEFEFGYNGAGVTLINNAGYNSAGMSFKYGTSTVGSIVINSASTSYNTTSDYRLKENITEITDGIDRLKQLKPSRFNFIGHEEVVDGFIAHEAQTVVPEAVSGEKDAVDYKGDPDYQGIDQSKLVPLLTAALQEAVAKIEALEQRISNLENK